MGRQIASVSEAIAVQLMVQNSVPMRPTFCTKDIVHKTSYSVSTNERYDLFIFLVFTYSYTGR